eukprot:TRINITY_DN80208_c0_g1_i5.p1 TRINITY_DN80208_c0_g1~~TRINITY_DN80208_c0_g1_i5.p1  ORF type:complete len:477 (-),score=48.91 TRINITY_DN80208_c0_g1_i5:5182-6612(-)
MVVLQDKFRQTSSQRDLQRVDQPNFSVLPLEVQQDIFRRVNQTDRITKLPLVCKRWEAALRGPSCAWSEFTLAPASFQMESRYLRSGNNPNKQVINFCTLEQWLRQRIEGMKVIRMSDRFGSDENHKRMHNTLLNNLPYAVNLESLELAFKSPFLMDYFLPRATPFLTKLTTLKLETWSVQLTPERMASVRKLTTLRSLTIGTLYGYGDTEKQPLVDGFPSDVLALSNLERLQIRSRGVINIPDTITQLKNLSVLNMEGCLVSRLPECLASLQNLHEINLSKNRISAHIDNIADVVFAVPCVEKVDLSSNQLQELPLRAPLSSSKSLDSLNLSSNFLDKLPNISSFKKLKSLDLSKNAFSQVPDELLNLESLESVDLKACRSLEVVDPVRDQLSASCDVKLPSHVQYVQAVDNEIVDMASAFSQATCSQEAEAIEEENKLMQRSGLLKSLSGICSGISSLSKTFSLMLPNLDIEWF